jgi:shikimate kinase
MAFAAFLRIMRRKMTTSVARVPKFSRIVLLGFMGAGKSTAGPLLSSRLGWSFFDADDVLIQRSGHSIEELFIQHGEPGFRELEATTVAHLLQQQQAVIALGGGAIENPGTRDLLAQMGDTCTVFLEAQLQTMIDRCDRSATVRPLLKDREGLAERYNRRLPHYRKATITVPTDGLTPEAIVEVLLRRLAKTAEDTETAGQATRPIF